MDDIVITGFGIKAPGIKDKSSFLEVLEKGICTQSLLNNQQSDPIVAGIIHDDFLEINGKNYKRHSRSARMAIAAALDADETCQTFISYDPHRIAVIIGHFYRGH